MTSLFPALYFALCILVALFGIGRWGGFLLYFAIAFFVTPIGALLLLIVTSRRRKPAVA